MNPAADPLFVAAEVAYRFERDRTIDRPATSSRSRRGRIGRWSRRLSRWIIRHRPVPAQ